MATKSHTPGPWRLTDDDVTTSIVGPDGDFVVAGECDGFMVPFSSIEDARLVVTAPELLVALRNMVEMAELNELGWLPSVEAARSVIAKAEGIKV